MEVPLQPILLFADSQLLFWSDNGTQFLSLVKEMTGRDLPKAAYIGASNGDDPQFYSIFEAAMQSVDIHDCKMILSSFSSDDQRFVQEADIILLAGGDVEKGWNVFNAVGLKDLLIKRYYEGALLIGISAGAAQLGVFGLIESKDSLNKLIDTFKLVPFIISAHDEKQEWQSLRETIQLLEGSVKGIGIPSGGGMIYYPDHSIEAIRYPLYEFSIKDQKAIYSLLIPGQKQQ